MKKFIYRYVHVAVILLLIIGSCWFIGCTKVERLDSPVEVHHFHGVTLTDNQGNIISTDTTDWRFDDKWTKKESDLFKFHYDTTCAARSDLAANLSRNPNAGYFMITITSPHKSLLEFILVNEKLRKIWTYGSIEKNVVRDYKLGVGLASEGLNDTFRLYYRVVVDSCAYRGHGDMIIIQ